jgi:predicted metal-dependent phosphoesterase TrpH
MASDLHIHTNASDGILSPFVIVQKAVQAGLLSIAITDHDTIDGIQSIYQNREVKELGLTIIPGIEFSTDMPQREVHILGYYIDITNPALRNQLHILHVNRRDRAKKMVAKVSALGYDIHYDEVLAIAGETSTIGRPHIARILVEKNYFPTVSSVFDAILEKDRPGYVPHYKLSVTQIITLIHQAGGIAVLAHPGLIEDDSVVISMIQTGVQGIEVYHPSHTEGQTKKYLKFAEKYHLAVTGGSDFHATPGRFPEKLGVFTVPDQLALHLQYLSSVGKGASFEKY